MGTVQHHQARSDALLRHARNATEAAIAAPATPGPHPPDYIDPFIDGLADAADSIRRAAAHAATALAVHIGLRHNTTRRLQIALTDAIFCDHLRRGHFENLPPHLHLGGCPEPAHARLQNRQPSPRRRQRRPRRQCRQRRERRPRRPPPPPSPHSSLHHRPPRPHRPYPYGHHHPDHPQDAEARGVPQKRHRRHHRRPAEAGPPRQAQPPLRHRLRPHHAHRRRNPVRRRNHPACPTTRNS